MEHPAVTAFREYLRIPSVHPDPDYGPCVEFLRKQAEIVGLPIAVYGTEKKPVVVLTWAGTRPELPSILLNSHMDVVPVFPEKWTYPPFSAHKTEDGKIYGRGSQDMKILTIQYLAAVQKLMSEGFRPIRTVHLIHVPDEEIGGAEGMGAFVKSEEFKMLNVGCALDEGAASATDIYTLYNDERSKWIVNILCTGPTGHGSLLHENTAGEKVRVVLDHFFERRAVEEKKLRELQGATGDALAVIGNVTSINLTIVKGGVQNNVVPDCIQLTFDIRLSVHEDHEEFLKWMDDVCKKAGKGTVIEFPIKDGKVAATPVDSANPFWPPVKSVLDKLGKKIIISAMCGATDMRFLRQLNIPCFGFSPLSNCPVLLHDHDEHVREQDFLAGIDIYIDLIKALTATKASCS